MTGKRVPIGLRPGAEKSVDDWVTESRVPNTPPASDAPVMKRLTIDVPEDLHRRLKVKAATEGAKMADLVRAWITERCES